MFRFLIYVTIKFLYSLRYQVKVKGLEELKGTKGHLIIPNHISLLEPPILAGTIWPTLKPRPVITQPYFDLKQFQFIFRLMGGISAPNFIVGTNLEKQYQLESCLSEILKGLKEGDNVLFYPAGRLKLQEEEKIDGSSGLYRLLQKEGQLSVILVRITGLWGSMFSNAVHGRTPSILRQLLKAGAINMANLFFFMPKRKVEIEFEKRVLKIEDFKDKRHLNQTLEGWYNAKGDPFYSPPYHFLFRNKPLKCVPYSPPVTVKSQEILDDVLSCIEKIVGKKVGPKEHLAYDLSMDSLEHSELVALLEEKYEQSDLWTTELATAEHIVALIEGSWVPKRLEYSFRQQGKMIEKFLKKKQACLDEVQGMLTWFKIGGQIRACRKVFENDDRQKIPLLIAGGIEACAAALGVYIAKKEPLFLMPEQVNQFEKVYTTKETIIRWNVPSMAHQAGTLIYLPEKYSFWWWKNAKIPMEDEAKDYLKDKKVLVNTFFQKDPLLFVAMTKMALKYKIPVVLPFAGVRNHSWQRRISSYFKDSKEPHTDEIR